MFDITAAFLERPLTLHEFTGTIPSRGIDKFSPVGMFRAGDDEWLSIVIPTDEMWVRCAEAMSEVALIQDPELDTVLKRSERMQDLVIPKLEAWASNMNRDEVAAALRQVGQPVGIVQDIAQVRRHMHLAHRELFVPMVNPVAVRDDGERIALPRLPLLFDGKHAMPGPVPRLGEHNTA